VTLQFKGAVFKFVHVKLYWPLRLKIRTETRFKICRLNRWKLTLQSHRTWASCLIPVR